MSQVTRPHPSPRDTEGSRALRDALIWSMAEQRRTGELPPLNLPPPEPAGPQGAVPPERTDRG